MALARLVPDGLRGVEHWPLDAGEEGGDENGEEEQDLQPLAVSSRRAARRVDADRALQLCDLATLLPAASGFRLGSVASPFPFLLVRRFEIGGMAEILI